MPPFTSERFKPNTTSREKELKARKEALATDLYERLLRVIAEEDQGAGKKPFSGPQESVKAIYGANADGRGTQAWAETHYGSSYTPVVSMRTRPVTVVDSAAFVYHGPPVRQLTLWPTGKDDKPPRLVDVDGQSAGLTDRQAVQVLEAGIDTVAELEKARLAHSAAQSMVAHEVVPTSVQ